MKGLNKKLSENIERKIDQLESSALTYLLSICFLSVSVEALISLNPYLTTAVIFAMFWTALSIKTDIRVYIYLFSVLFSAYAIHYRAFMIGGLFAGFLIVSKRIFKFISDREDAYLYLGGVLSHIGDIYTTTLGIGNGLSEQNPFLNYLGEFAGISSGLILSKTVLFIVTGYLYRREFEEINAVMKAFLVSGFFLTLSNLDVILSGI